LGKTRVRQRGGKHDLDVKKTTTKHGKSKNATTKKRQKIKT
jgi:hypothetical protein